MSLKKRKTKIVCTLGPATVEGDTLRNIILAGMDVARFNFSHDTHENHLKRFEQLKALREELNLPIATMLDTKGPEIRLGDFSQGKVALKTGQEFTLTVRDEPGDEQHVSITYKDLPKDISVGTTILIDDGLVELTVLGISSGNIRCRVVNGGVISNK